jgi:hypothetical protein
MLHEQFEHQHDANTIENEKLEFQIVAISVEMAASSPKMLRIARRMD